MNWFTRLRWAWNTSKLQRWKAIPAWNKDDARALQSFLASPVGRKLTIALQNAVIEANHNAVHATGCLQTACGYAKGQAALAGVIELMARPGSISGSENDPPPGTDEEGQQ